MCSITVHITELALFQSSPICNRKVRKGGEPWAVLSQSCKWKNVSSWDYGWVFPQGTKCLLLLSQPNFLWCDNHDITKLVRMVRNCLKVEIIISNTGTEYIYLEKGNLGEVGYDSGGFVLENFMHINNHDNHTICLHNNLALFPGLLHLQYSLGISSRDPRHGWCHGF